MRILLRACMMALVVCAAPSRAQFVDPSLRWRTFDTAHFTVHYAEPQGAQARAVAGVAESVYPRITAWLRWTPREKTQIVVLDSLDPANGFASPIPFTFMGIILSPPDSGELLQNREWLELVVTHEFTHVVHLDKASGPSLAFRRVFGRLPFLPYVFFPLLPSAFPNVLEPSWLTEGLAVYAESEQDKGYGRLGQGRFDGMMRAEVARGLRSLREVNAGGRGFPLNRDYLYGSYFFAFLSERYGPEAPARYVENYSGNWFPFRVDSAPVPVTGKTMGSLWIEYQDWLRARFVPGGGQEGGGEVLTQSWSLTSPVVAPGGERWYVLGDGYTRRQLVRQAQGGEAERVRTIESQARLSVSPRGEVLVSQPEICRNHSLYYDLYRLGRDGGLERLSECGRFRFAAPLADGRIAAIRVVAGEAEVVLLDRDGTVERTLYRAASGEALTGLAAKGEELIVTSLLDGRWRLIRIAGSGGNVLLADDAVKHSPRLGESGDEIFFVGGYGKVDNVWSLRPGERRLARWSDAPNGVREISAPVGGEMLLTTVEADGDVLRVLHLPAQPLETRETGVLQAPPAAGARAAGAGDDRPYSPWASLRPGLWYPALTVADGAFALGAGTYGQDALGLHQYAVAAQYELTQNEALGSASYVYDERHGLLLNRAMTVKSSVTNDQKLTGIEIRAFAINETAQWVSLWRDLSLGSRLYWGLGGALDRQILHDLAAGRSTSRDERVLGLLAGIDRRREQLLSEGPSEGQELRLFAETSNRLRGSYAGNFYRSDLRLYVPAGRTVVSVRWNEAYAQPQAEAIQLGGILSEETFALPVLNQREFSLRGYRSGENVLTGHRARLGTLEWRVPLSDIDRHFMVPPVGVNRLSASVFLDAGAAWDRGEAPAYYKSGGVEILSEARLGYLFGAQVRIGYAKGFQAPGRKVGYIRIGRSF